MQKILNVILVVGMIIFAGALYLGSGNMAKNARLGSDITFINTSIPTNSSSTLTTSSGATAMIATSTSRGYLRITNDSQNSVYLAVGRAAVLGKGIYLSASSSITFTPDFMFTAAIYGIASAANTNVAWISSDN